MPKIRGIKADLWTDENFVELSSYARLLWIGMWNYACDNGHLQDKPKQIKMRVLPTDETNCSELLSEIENQGLIERGDGWITIPNLTHHQKPHKRWFVLCEKPGCTFPEGKTYGYSKPATTVEQPLSNREQRLNNRRSTADVDVDVDGDGDKTPCAVADATSHTEADRFEEFWATYRRKGGKKPAHTKWKSALKKRGVTADRLIAAAADYIASQEAAGKFPEYTKDASTWLNGEHWNDELPTSAVTSPGPSWNTSSVPPCPPDVADDPGAYDRWLSDWREGREVETSDGSRVRRAS